ncbi:chemotaxis protein CheR [Agrobacterium vitis]|uniref:Chemotaxis protein methyltransferase n=1 Tax=Agrobacterium vitis TaxID=373 RepID=A0ABD6GJV0_AGRVI|nr:chemotaxis protein CheR [Agrobacterium vitis]MUO96043.1 chemotaxis protein CheR [Agrobacterium vitis]MUP07147.1 chemotaxis protein CheR [Agrobacterium vitis]MUZ84713.1 chemotaxis protein CheR [Agrobacterium vitis]MVA12339.1 chemotaxis protein CheR [Agrobacterium vitis]
MNALAEAVVGDHRISPKNFRRLSNYIFEYSGIKMPETKTTMLEGRLRRRLRATGFTDFDSYCHYIFEEDGLATESVHLIDAVTTNKTDFFREPNHFDYLTQKALPDLEARGVRRVRIWSSACSIGAEPYTIAMVMAEYLERRSGMDYHILATDLSTDVLQKARRGVYPAEMLEPVPRTMAARYVMHARDKQRNEVRIAPALRTHVGFARLNLMDDSYQVGEPMDIIFCRNVLIYFDKKTQFNVLQRLCNCLGKGGYMFIGHSESITGLDLPLKQLANTVFRKV